MKVTIVMPTYNCMSRRHRGGLCLATALTSLQEQTMSADDFEVIVVDDRSTDGTLEFVQQHCHLPHLTIIESDVNSGGASVPRNVGLARAAGEYVFFMDSDDHLSRNALESMYAFAASTGSDITVPRFAGVGRGAPERIFKQGNVAEADVVGNDLLSTMSVFRLYRREFLRQHGLTFPVGFTQYEDFHFNIEALTKKPKVSILADDTYYFWVRTDGENLSQRRLGFPAFLDLHQQILDLVDDEDGFVTKVRYLVRFLKLRPLRRTYVEYPTLEDDLAANLDHRLFKQFVARNIGPDVIECLPLADALLVRHVSEQDRYGVARLLTAVGYRDDRHHYLRVKGAGVAQTFEDELLETYSLRKRFGTLGFRVLRFSMTGPVVSLEGETSSSMGRTFETYRLVLRSRSAEDCFVVSSDKPDFSFNVEEAVRQTKGLWDLYVEVDVEGVVMGCSVAMDADTIAAGADPSEPYLFYRNWIGATTLRCAA